jgi:hypothetical protein
MPRLPFLGGIVLLAGLGLAASVTGTRPADAQDPAAAGPGAADYPTYTVPCGHTFPWTFTSNPLSVADAGATPAEAVANGLAALTEYEVRRACHQAGYELACKDCHGAPCAIELVPHGELTVTVEFDPAGHRWIARYEYEGSFELRCRPCND